MKEKKFNLNSRTIAEVAIIAALYVALTIAIAPLSFSNVQFRVSEALLILVLFKRSAFGGLSLGVFLSNTIGLFMGLTVLPDIFMGTLATVIALILTYYLIKISKFLLFIPTIIVNGIVIGLELYLFLDSPLFLSMLYVGLGELGVLLIVGIPLWISLKLILPYEEYIK